MPRKGRTSTMSDALKYELADELGVGEIARREGFGEGASRSCGNLVKRAIERAERTVSQNRNR